MMHHIDQMKSRMWDIIVMTVSPHQHDTQYLHDDNTPLRIWMPRDDIETVAMPSNYIVKDFLGIVDKDAIATDAFAGGLATMSWQDCPIEDLIRIEQFIKGRLNATQKV